MSARGRATAAVFLTAALLASVCGSGGDRARPSVEVPSARSAEATVPTRSGKRRRPVVIDRFGFYNLRRLGDGGFTLQAEARQGDPRVLQRKRRGSLQPAGRCLTGPGELVPRPAALPDQVRPGGSGFAAVGASPKGGAAALIEFIPEGDWITWSTFSLVDGAVRGEDEAERSSSGTRTT